MINFEELSDSDLADKICTMASLNFIHMHEEECTHEAVKRGMMVEAEDLDEEYEHPHPIYTFSDKALEDGLVVKRTWAALLPYKPLDSQSRHLTIGDRVTFKSVYNDIREGHITRFDRHRREVSIDTAGVWKLCSRVTLIEDRPKSEDGRYKPELVLFRGEWVWT